MLILITLFIDSMGFGVIIPVIPELLKELSGDNSNAHAALLGGLLLTAYATMQFFFGPRFRWPE